MKKEYIKPQITEEVIMTEYDLCQTSGHVDDGSMNNEGEEEMARGYMYESHRQSLWDD